MLIQERKADILLPVRFLRLVTVSTEKTIIIAENKINIIWLEVITQLLSLIVNLVYLMFLSDRALLNTACSNSCEKASAFEGHVFTHNAQNVHIPSL